MVGQRFAGFERARHTIAFGRHAAQAMTGTAVSAAVNTGYIEQGLASQSTK